MKAGQVVLLVLTGAIGGAVLISMAQRLRPAIPADVSAQVREPAPVAAAEAVAPKPSPRPERREAPKPQRFTRKAEGQAARLPDPLPAQPSAQLAASVPTIAPPPARIEPENGTPAASPGSTPAPPPRQVTLNAGWLIPVRLVDGLSSERNAPGDAFLATLDGDLAVDGLVIVERGARVEGKVVVANAAALTVELTRLYTNDGQTVAIQTDGFERRAEAAGRKANVLPAVTRITFRVKSSVQLTERLRRK
ncbi:MAG: hypothetical protein ABSF62_06895 [Bryobacteraceae bacterium]